MCYNSRSWQNPSNREDNPTPVPEEKKIMGLDLSKSKTHPARKITTSCSTPSIMKNSAMTSNSATISNSNMFSVKMATNMQSPGNKCKTWGPPCLFCVQSILHPSQLDSDWSEEEWEQEIEKEKSGEKQRKEEMLWRQAEEKKVLSSNHYPLVSHVHTKPQRQNPYSDKWPDTGPREPWRDSTRQKNYQDRRGQKDNYVTFR